MLHCAYEPFAYVCFENYMSGFFAFVLLTWVSVTIFCLDQCQMEIDGSTQYLCHW